MVYMCCVLVILYPIAKELDQSAVKRVRKLKHRLAERLGLRGEL